MSRKPSLFTVPNLLTFFRVLLIPLFIWLFLWEKPQGKLLAAIVFAVASLTDFFDGFLARKLNQVTEFGIFMDQFADKLLVWPALILFATVEELFIPYWFGIVIFLRDLAMTILRAVVKKKTGVSMKTSYWGKSKSAVQMFTVITILLILSFMGTEQGILKAFVDFALDKKIPFWSMALCVFLTLLSMLVYFADNREALAKLGSSK